MKSEFYIVSKKSIIGFGIKLFIFLLFLSFFVIDLLQGAKFKMVIYIMLLILYLIYALYNLIKEKTKIDVRNSKLKIFYTKGIPIRNYQFEYELQTIQKIVLKQTHDLLYGTKMISVIFKDKKKEDILVNLRYYQLVQIQNFFQENTNIKVILIG